MHTRADPTEEICIRMNCGWLSTHLKKKNALGKTTEPCFRTSLPFLLGKGHVWFELASLPEIDEQPELATPQGSRELLNKRVSISVRLCECELSRAYRAPLAFKTS